MLQNNLLRQATRASASAIRTPAFTPAVSRIGARAFTSTPSILDKKNDNPDDDGDHHDRYSTASRMGEFEHEGKFSRTDNSIQIEYPEEENLPSSKPVQGRGGFHFKRTLSTFSLEDKVGVVTGGARGLGLVMSQALILSGSDVAIVDLNRELYAALYASYCN